jgi:hypothetical protein
MTTLSADGNAAMASPPMGTKAGNESALAADGIASWSGRALTFLTE